ncbi:MAG: Rieske 2Fe-2S domain-containing protein [Cyanobacteria bacterium J06626_23]
MERREFLTWMGIGSLAASLPVVLAACQSETAEETVDPTAETAEDTAAATGGSEVVGTLAELDGDGFILNESASIGPVLVVAQPDNPTALEAVNPTCTHAGCTVDWDGEATEMICACHGSRFATNGDVLQGPAMDALERYTVSLDGDNVVVSPA